MKNQRKLQRILVFSVCLFLFSLSLRAQEEETAPAKELKYGFKAGIVISRFSSEQPHNNFKPGFTAGVFVNYPLNDKFSLQLEPAYFQQGGNLVSIIDNLMFNDYDNPYMTEVEDRRVTYHNVDAPLLARYDMIIGGLKIFVVAGPSFGFNVNTTYNAAVSARSMSETPVYYYFERFDNITSNIKSMHYGVTAGAGFEVPVGNHYLMFDARYRYSINNTYPGYSYLGLHNIQGDLKSNSIYFTLGFGF